MSRTRSYGLLGLVGVTALGGALAIPDRAAAPAWMVNESSSLPPGIYRRRFDRPVATGVVIAFRQPELARPYLRTVGAPPDMDLLKRVAAGPGDPVCVSGDRIDVGGLWLARVRRDRRGVGLPRWTACRRLRADEVFVLGDTASSFDSRYFGPVRKSQVRGVYEEAILW